VRRGGAVAVNEAYLPIAPIYWNRGKRCEVDSDAGGRSAAAAAVATFLRRSGCYLQPGSMLSSEPQQGDRRRARPTVESVALFHYATRSEEDFRTKQRRAGGVMSSGKPRAFFVTIERCVNFAARRGYLARACQATSFVLHAVCRGCKPNRSACCLLFSVALSRPSCHA
jgi:hypothetical protein